MDNELLIEKMRKIRDAREKEIFDLNSENEFSQINVEEIRYAGKMEFRETIEGKEELVEKDVFIILENNDGSYIYKYYDENMQLLGVQNAIDSLTLLSGSMMQNPNLTDKQKQEVLKKLQDSPKDGKTLEELEQEIITKQDSKESSQKENQDISRNLTKAQIDRMAGPQTLLNQQINGRTLGNTIGLKGKYIKMVDADILRREKPDLKISSNIRNVPIEIYEDGNGQVIGEDKLKMSHMEGKNPVTEQVTVRNDGTVAKEQNIETYNIVASGGRQTISIGYDEQFKGQQQKEIKFGERDISNPTKVAYTELKSTYEYEEQVDETREYQKETGINKGKETIQKAEGDKKCLENEEMSVENVDSNPNNNIIHNEDVIRYANAMGIYKDGTRLPDLEKARRELEELISNNPDKTVDEIIKGKEEEEKTLGPNKTLN